MTKEKLIEMFKTLVGVESDHVGRVVSKLLFEEGLKDLYFYQSTHYKTTWYLEYKHSKIAVLELKREKKWLPVTRYTWSGKPYETREDVLVVKSVEVVNWWEKNYDPDHEENYKEIADYVAEINKREVENEQRKIDDFNKLVEEYKKIKALYPDLNEYEFEKLLHDLYNKSWSIRDRIKQEEGAK